MIRFKPVLVYAAVATPVCALIFLVLSGFFTAWSGRAISHRPAASDSPAVLPVLIVSEGGAFREADWPTAVVESLDLAADPTGIPPRTLPSRTAPTRKARYSLFFTVTHPSEEVDASDDDDAPPTRAAPVVDVVPTTSPRALGLSILAWFGGLGLLLLARNTRVSEVAPQPNPANPTGTGQRPPGYGPPPPKRRKGAGRRR